MNATQHVPGPGWFHDGWRDPEGQITIHDSSVCSSVDSAAAAEALWPVVVTREDQSLIEEEEQSSDYLIDALIRVWVPAVVEQDVSSGDALWTSMEPTDVYVVVMRRPGDGFGTGFAMKRQDPAWQYSDKIPLGAFRVAEGLLVLQSKGVDPGSVRLLLGGSGVVFWLMYPTSSGDYEALLLDYLNVHDLYIAGRRVELHESVPWWFILEPVELHRWK